MSLVGLGPVYSRLLCARHPQNALASAAGVLLAVSLVRILTRTIAGSRALPRMRTTLHSSPSPDSMVVRAWGAAG